jgi:hypothetical protein
MSNKGLDVFGIQAGFALEKAKQVLEAKLNPSWIKQRQQGGTTLSYIGGHTVIRLLNKAFDYQWSFEIVTEEVKQSVPKPVYDGWGKNRKPKLDGDGNQIFEPQPPVAKVLGRLTVPGVGVKEQYGSKVLIGGATEQESAFKSASTDALKKCASLFGIGLELYGDDEGFDEAVEEASQPSQVQQPQQEEYQAPPAQKATPQKETPPPAKQETTQQTTASAAPGTWNQDDINRLKELKAILGITDNTQLDPYVREFFDNPNVNFGNITPDNIKAVNIFLAKKAEAI